MFLDLVAIELRVLSINTGQLYYQIWKNNDYSSEFHVDAIIS